MSDAALAQLAADLPRYLGGLWETAQIAVGGILLALVTGLAAGIATSSPRWWLRWPARIHIEVFRGTSALVQLYWLYYVLPQLFDLRLSGMAATILAMGLMISAYFGEVVRGALQAVPRGQREAAHALGLGPVQSLWRVRLPQAVPAMLPPWGNLVIELTKLTALALFVSLSDLLSIGRDLRVERPQDGLWIFLQVGIGYGLLCLLLVQPVRWFERPTVQRAAGGALLAVARVPAGVWRAATAGPVRWLRARGAGLVAWVAAHRDLLATLATGAAALAVLGTFAGVAGYGGYRLIDLWDLDFSLQLVFPALLRGLETTIQATLGGTAIALPLGLVFAGLVTLPVVGRPVRWIVEAIRVTPILVQLFVIYYGVLPAIGLQDIDPLWVGIVGLGVHYATYCAEVYRAGIGGVPHGQREAAHALGLHPPQTFIRVVLPQAIPRALPALGNYVVAMFKETPWLSAITVQEMVFHAEAIQSDHYRGIEAFTLAGVIFLILSLGAAGLVRLTERLWPVRHA